MAKAPRTPIDDMIDETDGVNSVNPPKEGTEEADTTPAYQVYKDSRIPVSKKLGMLWSSRRDTGKSKMQANGSYDAWDEAIKYYKNDQTGKKNRNDPDHPGTTPATSDVQGGAHTSTENIVFSNVSALVPSIYAKNPDCTVHSPKGDSELKFTTCAQKLLRVIMQKRTAPGVNLKPKMRRNVVMTTLTNIGWIEVGYTKKEVASDAALADIDKLAKEYAQTKDKKKILEIEGKLQALEEKIDLLSPAGPWTMFRHPKDVIVDPDASLLDGSDAKWIMIRDVFETTFINAVYREQTEDGEWRSLFEPTHVLKASVNERDIAGHDFEINNFNLIQEGQTWKDYGFDNEDAYKRAGRTFVWKVWDKVTRRVLWFADNSWKWPIWVWDDPYGLEDFFPLAPLAFHTDPEDLYARGEASYYLDQQDTINMINSQVDRMRQRVANMLVYDKNVIKEESDVLKLLRPVTSETVIGVSVPEGQKVADMLSAPPVPQVDFAQLFDKKSSFEAADRVSGVPSVVKGVEFRTNTTNKAIDSYESTSALRLDEKIDAIEECIGRVGYMLLFMMLQFMDKPTVIELIGETDGAAWPGPVDRMAARKMFSLTVTGGSSLKPTSKVRKEQAKEAGQILGQFGANNPAIVYVVMKMFARAFSDEIVLEQKDWDLIIKSIEAQLGAQMQQAQPQPPAGAQGAAPEGAANGNQPDPKQIVAMVGEMFKKMPPDIRKGVGEDIGNGVPLEEILAKLQNTQAQQQPPARSNPNGR